MTYDEWERGVPQDVKADSVWKLESYRLATFLGDLAWQDVTKLMRDRRTLSAADQLFRSSGSIAANLSEGFSRSTGRERARFYEFSLGSARETRDWYLRGRHILGERVAIHRIDLTTQIIRLILAMIPDQRRNDYRLSRPSPRARSQSRNHVIT